MPFTRLDRIFGGLKCTILDVPPSKEEDASQGYMEGSVWTVMCGGNVAAYYIFNGTEWVLAVYNSRTSASGYNPSSPLMDPVIIEKPPNQQWSEWVYLQSDYAQGPGV